MSKPIIAIVGRPNVGKSMLFNKIIGRRLSIVEDTPGVTRDRIYGESDWQGRKFTLIDTGGIEPRTDNQILAFMRSQAQIAIDNATVIVFLTDVRTGLTASDQEVANMLLRSGIETLTGVPSIVFGLMGVTVLFPVTQVFGATTTSILLGGLTMAIILLPTIIRSTEEALLVVPQHLRDASLSVGANQSQTIFKIVLPCAVPGILTGVLLGIGRVIGESAALIYTMGTFINDSPTLLSQGTSLAVQIWSIMSGEQPNYELACAISIIILVFVLILNFAVKVISKRFSKAWY